MSSRDQYSRAEGGRGGRSVGGAFQAGHGASLTGSIRGGLHWARWQCSQRPGG